MKLHTIYYESSGRVIKDDVPSTELFSVLPAGSRPSGGHAGREIENKKDGTKKYEAPRAVFQCGSERIIVQEKL